MTRNSPPTRVVLVGAAIGIVAGRSSVGGGPLRLVATAHGPGLGLSIRF